MDIIKDFFETIGSRIRSHFFGSIIISFIWFNWQSLYFVIYTDGTTIEKFKYFDDNVLLWQPLIIGIGLGILTPAIAWGGTWWAERFSLRINNIQDGSISNRKIDNLKHQAAEDEAQDRHELARTIANANRTKVVDDTLGNIEDETLKEQYREEAFSRGGAKGEFTTPISKLRKIATDLPITSQEFLVNSPKRSSREIKVMVDNNDKEIRLVQTPLRSFRFDSPEKRTVLANTLDELLNRNLIVDFTAINKNVTPYRVTDLGVEVGEYLYDLELKNKPPNQNN